jgi:hypothetical protein
MEDQLSEKLFGDSFKTIFDATMIRQHPARPQMFDPPKRLQDVETLMKELRKSTKGLARRTFFFDDRGDHLIRSEIPANHYIQITPAFSTGVRDQTNFQPIYQSLTAGGRPRKTRKHKKGGKKFPDIYVK